MRLLPTFICLVLLGPFTVCAGDGPVATNCREMLEDFRGRHTGFHRFDVTGSVISSESSDNPIISLDDGTGAIVIVLRNIARALWPQAGDQVRVTGSFLREPSEVYFLADNVEKLSSGKPTLVPEISAHEFVQGLHDYRPVKLRGTVWDACPDENDPRYVYLTLLSDGEFIYCAGRTATLGDNRPEDLIGAEVLVRGRGDMIIHANRRQIGRTIQLDKAGELVVTRPPSETPYEAPEVALLRTEQPARIPMTGPHRLSGRVEAIGRGNRLLVTDANGFASLVRLRSGLSMPAVGAVIDIVGSPETDLYHIHLNQAIWRPSAVRLPPSPKPVRLSPRSILYDRQGRLRIDMAFYGKPIEIEGIVRTIPLGAEESDLPFVLESDGCLVPVEFSHAPGMRARLAVDCRVRLTGVCVMEVESWRPGLVFPRIEGIRIILRSADDLTVLAHPPWWTSARLMLLALALGLALALVAVWTALLNRLANRRGRALADARIARFASELKVGERTRLAVELHDSIAQNLTGIALEMQTAEDLLAAAPDAARSHLVLAGSSLRSCREELRNCLCDLRSDALELKDMDAAIRATLSPQIGRTEVSVRFNVPRELFSDNTAHSILRIIRELVLNAVRHGCAGKVRVAGVIEGDRLLFSVKDNGSGFDPANRPGVREGHFGLQGIRERVQDLNGEFEIVSAPGKGTQATVTLRLPREKT